MENEDLRTAITRAGLTLEEFADVVQVDVKTVRRWLAGRTPYPRHRTRVAGALHMTEHALWPDAAPPPAESPERGKLLPVVTDVVAGYGHATDPAAPNVGELLRAAVERVEVIIPNLASPPGLGELFRTSSANGCRVRIIIEHPDEQVQSLLGIDAIEVRTSPASEDHVRYRADDEMLLVLTRIGAADASSPVIQLRRLADGGLFDRLADDFDERWPQATPLTSREQLHAYLADTELERSPEADPLPAPVPALPPEESSTGSLADAPRRWPTTTQLTAEACLFEYAAFSQVVRGCGSDPDHGH